MSLSQTAVNVTLLIGLGIVLLLTIRSIFATRQALTFLSDHSLAIQKLSADVFEIQNGHAEIARGVAGTTQSLGRIERELQSLGASLATVRASWPATSGESLAQFGKEIKRVLQTKEVNDFLESQNQQGK